MDDSDQTDELFSDAFMREHTDFATWDDFKRLLAATPRAERDVFVRRTTHFSCFREMEALALAVVERSERVPEPSRHGGGLAAGLMASSR